MTLTSNHQPRASDLAVKAGVKRLVALEMGDHPHIRQMLSQRIAVEVETMESQRQKCPKIWFSSPVANNGITDRGIPKINGKYTIICNALYDAEKTARTRSPPIGGAKRNAAPLNFKISADIPDFIDGALSCAIRIRLCLLDLFYALVWSIRLNFAA